MKNKLVINCYHNNKLFCIRKAKEQRRVCRNSFLTLLYSESYGLCGTLPCAMYSWKSFEISDMKGLENRKVIIITMSFYV